MTFKHLFLKDYVDGEMSRYAVYRQDDLYDHVHYIIEQVTEFTNFPFSMFLAAICNFFWPETTWLRFSSSPFCFHFAGNHCCIFMTHKNPYFFKAALMTQRQVTSLDFARVVYVDDKVLLPNVNNPGI